MRLCERCETPFKPKVSYQIYCGDVCREQATKIKIAERYQITRRQKRKGKANKGINKHNRKERNYRGQGKRY